jgi:hypothetical protein
LSLDQPDQDQRRDEIAQSRTGEHRHERGVIGDDRVTARCEEQVQRLLLSAPEAALALE